jgi:uncharacterized protein (DUF2132 family)
MDDQQPNNPLHGITLKALLEDLLARHGWEGLASRINIRCFSQNPTINSSLKFLRKTEWARDKVEALYLDDHHQIERNRKRNKRRADMRAARTDDVTDGKPDDEAGEGPAE